MFGAAEKFRDQFAKEQGKNDREFSMLQVQRIRRFTENSKKASTLCLSHLKSSGKGEESKKLVQDIQVEKRVQNRVPIIYQDGPDTWSPPEPRKITKADCLNLLKTINLRHSKKLTEMSLLKAGADPYG